MDIPENIFMQYLWLLRQWWFWLAFIASVAGHWYLLKWRSYKEVDKKLFVRHGRLGKWLGIEEHLNREHLLETNAWVICSCGQKHPLRSGMDSPVYWCGGELLTLKAGDKVEYAKN